MTRLFWVRGGTTSSRAEKPQERSRALAAEANPMRRIVNVSMSGLIITVIYERDSASETMLRESWRLWRMFRAKTVRPACMLTGNHYRNCFFLSGLRLLSPVTCTWTNHYYAGEAQAPLGAIFPSFIIGVLSAIACTIYLLKKANRGSR